MTRTKPCPLCSKSSTATLDIEICAHCHGNLQASGHIPVASTAEFAIPALPQEPHLDSHEDSASTVMERHCSWCLKHHDLVKKVLSKEGVHICNECVHLCADIMRMELGDDFS